MKPSQKNTTLPQSATGTFLAYILLCTLILTGILAGCLFVLHQTLNRDLNKKITNQKIQTLDHLQLTIQNELQIADALLIPLQHSPVVGQYFQSKKNQEEKELTSLLSALLKQSTNLESISLVDTQGREILSVTRTAQGDVKSKPAGQLRSLENEAFFRESLTLPDDKVAVSPLELESRDKKVLQPNNPILYLARPVKDNQGRTLGVSILQYSGDSLLAMINSQDIVNGHAWSLVNDAGYYLRGPIKDLDFSFMFPLKPATGLFSEQPELWKSIQSNRQGKWQKAKEVFYYKTFQPLPAEMTGSQPVEWTLILHPTAAQIAADKALLFKGIRLAAYIGLPLMLLLGILLGLSLSRTHSLGRMLRTLAERDELTGLYNRKSVLNKLEYLISLVKRNQNELSVVFADINGLKQVNDQLGHEAGDRMIQAAAQAFTKEIRETDIAARIGGDEFLILFPGCGADKVQLILERVLYHFDAAGRSDKGQTWKMSWGSASWQGKEDDVDSLIRRADVKMSQMKGRNREVPIL